MISYKDMIAAADAVVPRLKPAEAKQMIAAGNVLIVDVRDGTEVAQTGKLKGAVHVARGSLEGRADPDAPTYNPAFKQDQTGDPALRRRRPRRARRQDAQGHGLHQGVQRRRLQGSRRRRASRWRSSEAADSSLIGLMPRRPRRRRSMGRPAVAAHPCEDAQS